MKRTAISLALLASTALGLLSSRPTNPPAAPYIVITQYPVTGVPWGIANGPTGTSTLWFTQNSIDDTGVGNIGSITLGGGAPVFNYFTPSTPVNPVAIVNGADNALWFTASGQSQGQIGRLTTSGAFSFYSAGFYSQPWGITLGPPADPAVYFSIRYVDGTVGRIAPPVGNVTPTVTTYNTPEDNSDVSGVATGTDGLIYYVEPGAADVGRMTVPIMGVSTFAAFPVSGSLSQSPFSMTTGPNGTVWFTALNGVGFVDQSGATTVFTTSGPAGGGITTGPDNAVWFPETGYLGRATPGGQITEYPISALSDGGAIVTGPDGALWFTDQSSNIFRVGLAPALTITTTSLPNGAPGVPYSATLQASGVAPFLWSATGLPPGLTLSQAGALTGVPAAAGLYSVTITVSDSATPPPNAPVRSTQQVLPLLVETGPLTGSCPAARSIVGSSYSSAVGVFGGIPGYSINLTGSLPPGLTFNASNGSISGTPGLSGSFSFTIGLIDSIGQTASLGCQIYVSTGMTASCPAAAATLNAAYASQVAVSGGSAPYSFVLASGGLPPGLSLSTSSGSVAGAPTASGSYPFSVLVSDGEIPPQFAQISCNLAVNGLTITSSCPANGLQATQNSPYSFTVGVSGGTPPYSFQVGTTPLPAGLSLNASTGVISGTPTAATGTYPISIQVSDASSPPARAAFQCNLVVNPPLAVTSACPSNGVLGVSYGPFPLTASGGNGKYVFSIINGSLPAGLGLSGSTISGTPSAAGSSTFTVQVASGQATATAGPCTVNITGGLTLGGSCPTEAVVNTPLSVPVSPSGGVPPYIVSFTGSNWLSYTNSTVSGTPPAVGSGNFTVTAKDSSNTPAKVLSCTFPVVAAALQIVAGCPTAILVNAQVNLLYKAVGGTGTYTWSFTGLSWLSASGTTGSQITLSGTAPAVGSYPIQVTLNDSVGSGPITSKCTLIVVNPLQISASPPGCPTAPLAFQSSFSLGLAGAGGSAPYTWALTGPSWLSLSATSGANVTVSGTAPKAGSFPFTVFLTDGVGTPAATYSCTVVVNPPSIPTLSVSIGTVVVNILNPVATTVSLAAPAPITVNGSIQLTFTSNATNPIDNPQVTFSDPCQRLCSFTIPAGSSSISLPPLVLGTVAGDVHLEVVSLTDPEGDNVLSATPPSADITVPLGKPIITSMTIQNQTATGFDIVLSGYSTPRDMKSLTISFTPASGVTLSGQTSFTVDVSSLFTTFYQSTASAAGGSMFAGLQTSVSVTGAQNAIASVTVTLTNSAGQSDPMTQSP